MPSWEDVVAIAKDLPEVEEATRYQKASPKLRKEYSGLRSSEADG